MTVYRQHAPCPVGDLPDLTPAARLAVLVLACLGTAALVVALQLTGAVAWPWWVALAPFAPAVIALLIVGFLCLLAGFTD
jgi:hypothetical protein